MRGFWCGYVFVRFWAIWLVCFSVTFVVFGIAMSFGCLALVAGFVVFRWVLVVFDVVIWWLGWVLCVGVLIC